MPGDPYSDPVTGVLYTKLGLSTAAGLEAAEREITHAALILRHESPISPSYDLPHLREIHKRIFGDIYERAGQIRTVPMAKGAMFCLPQSIDSSAAIIFRELHDEDCLRGLSRDAFVGRLACYLGEVNAPAPVPRGQRAGAAGLLRAARPQHRVHARLAAPPPCGRCAW
jgi:cell filamentation protein, protein adenylyltransferase